MRKKRKTIPLAKSIEKRTFLIAASIVITLILPATAWAQSSESPVQGLFDAIVDSVAVPIRENKTVIMIIVGVLGLVSAFVAFASDSSGQDQKLVKVAKGAFLLIVIIQVFLFFI